LKPANLLLEADDYAYVTDFGLAKLLDAGSQLTGSGIIVGTPSYMAPEQAVGRRAAVGPHSDVYSLGAVLYEMLTGRPPFREATPLDTLVQVIESETIPPRRINPHIPPEVELICLKCMAKDPAQRYVTAAELADDLERFTRGEPIHARPQHFHQRLLRWVRQEPGLASHLAVLALIAAIAQVNYQLFHTASLSLHLAVLSLLGLWAGLSVMCQWLLRRDRSPDLVRLAWLGIDGVLLTVGLWLVEAVYSPLLIIYGLFIVASGLWFRARFVWFTTGLAAAGYGLLLLDAWRQQALGGSPHYHLIFFVGLLALGFMVTYQVQRVRALSRYYERRRFS
jgi:serine/threonine-protein kinase